MESTDKTIGRVLITGASSGIGAAYARQLASQGYALILVARRADALSAIARDLEARFGADVAICPADLSQEEGIARVEALIQRYDDITLLINNAGFGTMGSFVTKDVAVQTMMCRLHMEAPMRLCRAVLPLMVSKGAGAIINVSSIAAFRPSPHNVVYGATKAFLNQFSLGLAIELRGTGVRVQALCPGFTRTAFHDTPEFADFQRERVPSCSWKSADEVVRISLKRLEGKSVIVVTGWRNRLWITLQRGGPLFWPARALVQLWWLFKRWRYRQLA